MEEKKRQKVSDTVLELKLDINRIQELVDKENHIYEAHEVNFFVQDIKRMREKLSEVRNYFYMISIKNNFKIK
jgi:hypothetical protein